MFRITLALLALVVLTAFAPAPLPRSYRNRDRNLITLNNFQGEWSVVSMEIVQGNGQPHQKLTDWGENSRGTIGILVKGEVWSYLTPGGTGGTYRMSIDHTKQPAAINWYVNPTKPKGDDPPGMLGLIKRDGSEVTILYYATRPENRPTTFDNPPQGWWILKLRRK